MPLTPADVHNVAFKKPPIGKRGYDEEEVDAFLDEVERELARLIEENNELRAQVERGGRGGAPAGPGADPRLAAELNEVKAQLDRVQRDKAQAEQAARQMQAKADALERDARQRHQEAMGGLDAKRSALQKHIEELKQFEREYRTRLKAYLESQLRDLDGRGQGLEAELTRADSQRAVGGSGGLAAAGLAGSYGGSRTGAIESGR